MLNSARITCDFLGLKRGDSALLCMPLDYIAGKMMVVRSLERGLKIVCVEPSNHPLAAAVGDISFAAMVPSQVFCSLQVAEERERLKRIRHLIIGGGAISEKLAAELRCLHTDEECAEYFVWSTYGMTETLSHIALRRLNGRDASDWYVPFDSVHVSVNEEQCLVIDAPLVHEGRLVTNDIAEMQVLSDNKVGSVISRFRILGRKDNVICSGGIKLQIEEIETKLQPWLNRYAFDDETRFWCVSKCADEKFGEIVVLLLDKRTRISPEELEEAFEHLDRYSVPKKVVWGDEIPLTGTGKIDRKKCERIVSA